MADVIATALRQLGSSLESQCRNCGLRYGSCAHTSEAFYALTELRAVLAVVDREHQPQNTVHGPRCGACQGSPWPCPTRRGVAEAVS